MLRDQPNHAYDERHPTLLTKPAHDNVKQATLLIIYSNENNRLCCRYGFPISGYPRDTLRVWFLASFGFLLAVLPSALHRCGGRRARHFARGKGRSNTGNAAGEDANNLAVLEETTRDKFDASSFFTRESVTAKKGVA